MDKDASVYLTAMIKEGTQNENIGKMQTLINTTAEVGLTNDNLVELREIKIRINNLANQLVTQSQESPVLKYKRKTAEQETPPTNRIDGIFDALDSLLPRDLGTIVVEYDQDQCNEIIMIIQKDKMISSDVRKMAESMIMLDFNLYPGPIKNTSEILEIFKNVETLTMRRLAEEKDLEAVAQLKKLRSLDLTCCWNIKDAILAKFANLESLQSLNLYGCKSVTDIGLSHLVNLKFLQALNLGDCVNLTEACFDYLEELPKLQYLYLHTFNITNTGLAKLANFLALESLILINCNGVTDKGLDYLTNLSALKSLNLGWCLNITDEGLVHLVKFTHLTSLNVSGCPNITGQGIARAKEIKPLLEIIKTC